VLILFALVRRYWPAWAPHVLACASLGFAFLAGWMSLAFLAGSILGNHAAAGLILRLPPVSLARRLATAGAIVANLLPLAAFKLAHQWGWGFAGESATAFGAYLPIGLAFYSLQQISFLVDIQRADAVRLGFARYAAWSSFFGQLAAGPIATYGRMAPQYARLGFERLHAGDVARGLTLVLCGIVKKTWLADPLARRVDAILLGTHAGGTTPMEAWTAAWSFLLQLYLDFSAYSDIAIGVGLCLGLRLPINFNSPLKATTPGQYILRWHISLMLFVRDYVFEPLFRVARRLPIRPTARRYAIAWALSTLGGYLAVAAWHTLAPWVLLQGLVVTAALVAFQFLRLKRSNKPHAPSPLLDRVRGRVGQIVLLLAAAVTALCLREGTDGQIVRLLASLFDVEAMARLAPALLSGTADLFPNARLEGGRAFALIAFASAIVLLCPNTMQIFEIAGAQPTRRWLRWRPSAPWGWATIILLALALIGITRPVQPYAFIYARL
jgi:alginate O-acetyltransferase complex protein AlgI